MGKIGYNSLTHSVSLTLSLALSLALGARCVGQRARTHSHSKVLTSLAGFTASASQRVRIDGILAELQALNPTTEPAPLLLSSSSTWRLIYSDAPDIVGGGNQGLLLPRSGVIGQEFSAADGTVTNIVERVPPALLSAALPSDSVVQRVVLKTKALSATRVGLQIKGTSLEAARILNQDVSLWSLFPKLDLDLPAALPFGEFEILFYDGELRVVKTAQGYFGVNVRVADGTLFLK